MPDVTLKEVYTLIEKGRDEQRLEMREIRQMVADSLKQIRSEISHSDVSVRAWVGNLKAEADREHARIDQETAKIKKVLFGNGEPGLTEKVSNLYRVNKMAMAIGMPLLLILLSGAMALLWNLIIGDWILINGQ